MTGIIYSFSEFGLTIIILMCSCLFHLIAALYNIFTAILDGQVNQWLFSNATAGFSLIHRIVRTNLCSIIFFIILGYLLSAIEFNLDDFTFCTYYIHNWTMQYGCQWGNLNDLVLCNCIKLIMHKKLNM